MGASTATQTPQNSGDALATMSSMLGGLILVIGVILVLAYLVKRLKLVPANHGVIKTLSVTPLGQKEKLVLVELEGQQYLLGVTSQQVTLIDKLANSVTVGQDSFAERLRQAKSAVKPSAQVKQDPTFEDKSSL
ncbi:flagellar biosynthetic protein FliO [Shewanella sp. Isolate11]|uniref:flagellar biosynthetic protein FliO n=1 Tax=Shewanella sp. Isolate11 TaxID=2908530 RepID=UPI001EFED099|nr:flagellar biosynthetic protein FliO [Shewanella sp. Isolate11]MCG9697143.1 flagellar biosynthetic protein FliO [Shewanella sp. Isolate11]